MIRAGSQRWNTTAVGYFLGKKPYFHHLNEFVRSIWPGVRDVKATSNGFFFFQFETIAALEDVIEGGPWLYLGQPIVLQSGNRYGIKKAETHRSPSLDQTSTLAGGTLDDKGLSTVASGIGRPLYPDAITRACTRLDFARVCVMLNVNSKLPKHVVIMMPNEFGGESACKVDVEYEWLPPKCTGCSSLGHSTKECPLSKPTKPAVSIYVRKSVPITPAAPELKMRNKSRPIRFQDKSHPENEVDRVSEDMSGHCGDKAIWNVRGLNRRDHQVAVRDLVCEFRLHFIALLETRVLQSNATRIQSGVLSRWRWFVDYAGLGNRIWIAWNDELIDVDILNGLIDLVVTIGNVPWLVRGDFNAVLDMSEVNDSLGITAVWMVGAFGRDWIDCLLMMFGWTMAEPVLYMPHTSYIGSLTDGLERGLSKYAVTRKLKALKPIFRQQRRCKGDLAMNVKLAAGFLEIMLRQRAKLQWLKGETNAPRFSSVGFVGGDRTDRAIDLRYLRPWARHILTDDEAQAVIRPITIDEVKTAFFDIEEDKAPGPDGFSSGFFKAAWPVVGGEVRTPHSVAEFRPISCCNVIYKVITKIIVSRIRESLDLLISPSQNAFVPGRLISDNVLLAQELFSGYNQCRLLPRCALKVDLRKAYDTVEWDFLIATLRMFGFPALFIRWIEECVTSAHYSVVVNGRGISVHWRCQELKLFQLSFADDLLLLCKADVRSVNLFCRGLDRFATLSGLHTNPQKSQLIISKAASGLRDSLLATLGFQEGQLPVRYLGLPLISARLSIADCQPLLQKIDSRIKGWEGVQLSFAGRVQLIKSVLISFEVYWAMAFILPKGIIKEMIKRLRTFLWKGNSASGYPKVAWEADRTSIWVDWIIQVRLRDCSIWTVKENKGAWVDQNGLLDKLSVVIKDGQWNWPLITDIACLEITHMLPPILEGPDRISWKSKDGSFKTSTAYDLFHPPGPKDGVPETHDHLFFSCSFSAVALPSSHRSHSHGPTGIGNMVFNGHHPMAWKACG
ncbi:UNVERIFIED_CONTAM: hypothetical protein Sangu_3031200 [Sesamum angustifolium]|uniref:Reverse transcriptase domain-containing protein n=1 Tax=Sesamum angustifolium TaxID=2727405 RepID=A0AAW2KP94_9LAMI